METLKAALVDRQKKKQTFSQDTLKIALVGNPNSGKTSVFNYLTGARQRVANWGGVTVDIKEGMTKFGNRQVRLVDLPGTYSLSAYSIEEKVARDYVIDEHPDVVLNIVDAANLERNLYLTLQLLELGIKPVLAFNMWDEVEKKKLKIDLMKLEKFFGLTIIPTTGKTGKGVKEMLQAAVDQGEHNKKPGKSHAITHFPTELSAAIANLASHESLKKQKKYSPQWLATKLLENDSQVEEYIRSLSQGDSLINERDKRKSEIENLLGDDPESIIAEARYGLIAGALRESIKQDAIDKAEMSDKIDNVLTHPVLAYPIFIVFLWLLFQATFTLGVYPMDWIEAFCGWLGGLATTFIPAGNVQDLMVDGIIGGVGGVIVFLPNILILFLGISIMEDTGYMARAAFIMDKIMHKMGLHGKSFVPVIMGLGCNVPAIMATRTLESPKDRIKTILLAPLISCSARLPVYILFAAALFPTQAGNVVFLFQFIFSISAFFLMGVLFKKTILKGEDIPFVMELPPYRLPTLRSVIIHMWHKAEHYLKKMGGVVLVFSIILWFAGAFPKYPEIEKKYDEQIKSVATSALLTDKEKEVKIADLKNAKVSEVMSQTYIGKIGKFFEPLVKPLGFDWRGAVSLVTGFVAKEVVVSSMGVLYAVGEEEDSESTALQGKIAENFTPLSGFAFMMFVLLYTPCIVALVTLIRELKSWKWSIFSIGYQLVLAYVMALVIFQGGRLLGLS